jgi:pyruvate formate lyase activating enzyme
MTLSGGEPLFQAKFAAELLREARAWGIDAAFETSGAVPAAALLEAASLASSVIYDLKHWDPAKLAGVAGFADPSLPSSNLKMLKEALPDLPVTVRIPVIPGFNDSLADLARIASLAPPGLPPPELLPYHRLGDAKRLLLGREPSYRASPPDPAAFEALRAAFLRNIGF